LNAGEAFAKARHTPMQNTEDEQGYQMIKKWHLRNFKAFRDHDPVDLSMVNVLAGANSSGNGGHRTAVHTT
jgi:hypothetical protein